METFVNFREFQDLRRICGDDCILAWLRRPRIRHEYTSACGCQDDYAVSTAGTQPFQADWTTRAQVGHSGLMPASVGDAHRICQFPVFVV